MWRRMEIYLLAGLLILLAALLYFTNRSPVPGLPGVLDADTKFQPLDVQGPQLHLDLLEKIQKLEYSGSHRNIFVAMPPPIPKAPEPPAQPPFVGPTVPPPPPPLEVPATYFGYASQSRTGKRVAFFTSGDDVLIVAEGDTFLNRFRLVHIGDSYADVEEVSTGRRATVPMVQPDQSLMP